MTIDPVDRFGADSNKWRRNAPDVIPIWDADKNLAADPQIIDAVPARRTLGCKPALLTAALDRMTSTVTALCGYQAEG